MVDDPYEIILDHLRHIRKRVDGLDIIVRELKEGQINIRDDIHGARGDFRRYERALAAMEADIERIKTRLDLTD